MNSRFCSGVQRSIDPMDRWNMRSVSMNDEAPFLAVSSWMDAASIWPSSSAMAWLCRRRTTCRSSYIESYWSSSASSLAILPSSLDFFRSSCPRAARSPPSFASSSLRSFGLQSDVISPFWTYMLPTARWTTWSTWASRTSARTPRLYAHGLPVACLPCLQA